MLIDLLESSKAIGLCPMGMFDTLMIFLKEFFEKVKFEKICRRQKSLQIYPECKKLIFTDGTLKHSRRPRFIGPANKICNY